MAEARRALRVRNPAFSALRLLRSGATPAVRRAVQVSRVARSAGSRIRIGHPDLCGGSHTSRLSAFPVVSKSENRTFESAVEHRHSGGTSYLTAAWLSLVVSNLWTPHGSRVFRIPIRAMQTHDTPRTAPRTLRPILREEPGSEGRSQRRTPAIGHRTCRVRAANKLGRPRPPRWPRVDSKSSPPTPPLGCPITDPYISNKPAICHLCQTMPLLPIITERRHFYPIPDSITPEISHTGLLSCNTYFRSAVHSYRPRRSPFAVSPASKRASGAGRVAAAVPRPRRFPRACERPPISACEQISPRSGRGCDAAGG